MVKDKAYYVNQWRKVGWGRLYWRSSHRRWRTFFDSDDICVIKDGTASMHVKSLRGLDELIEYCRGINGQPNSHS